MRKIGTLPTDEQAERFSDFLYVKGIENSLESADDGTVEIWVHSDEELDVARQHLDAFRQNPADAAFAAAREADRKRAEEEKQDARRKSRVINRERLGYERTYAGFAWVPALLAMLSAVCTFLAGELGFPSQGTDEAERASKRASRDLLSITVAQQRTPTELLQVLGDSTDFESVNSVYVDRSLPEVRKGQFWRLFTPMFIHFGIMHIVFNIMWLRDLGSFMQNRFGAVHLLIFVLLTAALSNYAQLLMSGPYFGGMSGVNYGLFGFLWIRGKYDRFAGWSLNPTIVQTMLLWFVLCLTGLLGNIANTAHAVGLICGMAWGWLSAKRSVGA